MKLKVLVVDDDPVHRQMATAFLGMGGFEVATAENGAAALGVLESRRFDIALVDVEMPVMGGLEFLQRIGSLRLLADMPTIMATSRDDIPVIDRAFELGASDFTVKPVNWGLLTHEMRFVLRAAANEKAAAAARDEALRLSALKDQILAVVRHELRSPLQSIIGFGKLVTEGARASGNTALSGHADAMLEGSERLNRIISDMMLHLDLQAGRMTVERDIEPVSGLLEALAPLLRRPAGDGVLAPFIEDASNGAAIRVQPTHVAQAAGRLVDNIVRHAAADRVIFSARRIGEQEICIEIADDGVGFSPLVLAETSRAFTQGESTLARTAEGLGLGLAIVEGLVRLNGGRLELSNGAGGGAVAKMIFAVA
ncbi:MAG: ATP-binding response regulator [Beijerinckiaceae bacterium]